MHGASKCVPDWQDISLYSLQHAVDCSRKKMSCKSRTLALCVV